MKKMNTPPSPREINLKQNFPHLINTFALCYFHLLIHIMSYIDRHYVNLEKLLWQDFIISESFVLNQSKLQKIVGLSTKIILPNMHKHDE